MERRLGSVELPDLALVVKADGLGLVEELLGFCAGRRGGAIIFGADVSLSPVTLLVLNVVSRRLVESLGGRFRPI